MIPAAQERERLVFWECIGCSRTFKGYGEGLEHQNDTGHLFRKMKNQPEIKVSQPWTMNPWWV